MRHDASQARRRNAERAEQGAIGQGGELIRGIERALVERVLAIRDAERGADGTGAPSLPHVAIQHDFGDVLVGPLPRILVHVLDPRARFGRDVLQAAEKIHGHAALEYAGGVELRQAHAADGFAVRVIYHVERQRQPVGANAVVGDEVLHGLAVLVIAVELPVPAELRFEPERARVHFVVGDLARVSERRARLVEAEEAEAEILPVRGQRGHRLLHACGQVGIVRINARLPDTEQRNALAAVVCARGAVNALEVGLEVIGDVVARVQKPVRALVAARHIVICIDPVVLRGRCVALAARVEIAHARKGERAHRAVGLEGEAIQLCQYQLCR